MSLPLTLTPIRFYLADPGGNGLITATAGGCVANTAAESNGNEVVVIGFELGSGLNKGVDSS